MRTALLDTMAVLRYSFRPELLSAKAQERILNNEGALVYSIVSLWEIGIKMSKRGYHDLNLPADWDQRIVRGFQQQKVEAIEITPRHCKMVEELPGHHYDPFDRMIFAQAIERDFALVSSDQNAPLYVDEVIW